MNNPVSWAILEEYFLFEEDREIVAFLEKGFSPNGDVIIFNIFVCAGKNGLPFVFVFDECKDEWERTWRNQCLKSRGDPNDPSVGMQNIASLRNIYLALGILSPGEEGREEIPSGPLVVRAGDLVYKFGPADDEGIRTISRDRIPLSFARCRITSLEEGKPLWFFPIGSSSGEPMATSAVDSITVSPI